MAAPSYVRDKTRDKTYGKIGVKERRNEEMEYVCGITMKQVTRERRMARGGHVEKL